MLCLLDGVGDGTPRLENRSDCDSEVVLLACEGGLGAMRVGCDGCSDVSGDEAEGCSGKRRGDTGLEVA